MAQIIDYASLVSAVVDYDDRSTDSAFMGRIDTFIGLAEDEWMPGLQSRFMEETATLTTATDGSIALPADFYRVRALYGSVNGLQTNLPMIGPVAEQGLYPDGPADGDTPNFARIMGSTLYVVPEQVQTVTLDYWAQFVGLSATNTTNWIILNHPTLYFYSVMAQAYLWLKDFQTAQTWGTLAENQYDQINGNFARDYYNNTDLVLDTSTP